MAIIKPFKGVRPPKQYVEEVESRPYDVLDSEEARAEVIQAEAEVPKALAQALRDGNMGFMDYYKLQNLKGDTAMRERISKLGKEDIKDILE